ncbi:MAG TPA: glycosyltransferase family A protein [Nitrolancea sp.]|nr:glycosyltransferase family A protein [Nitrolancea sp.]
MAKSELVSVIIIFWNAEPFLTEAVASVVAQTHPHWELLLVDDGSTDGSTEIAKQLVVNDPERMRYLEHPGHANRGMSASRNLGIAHAQGTYLAFLDADDVWFPQALAEQVEILRAEPAAGMVYGPIEWWHSWTGRPEDCEKDYVERLGVPANTLIPPPRLLPLFLRDRAAVPSGLMVRRDLAERVGGFEDDFRGEYEDQVFCAKVCLNASVYASARCWYRYRQHPNSAVAGGMRSGATHAARLAFLNWLADYLTSNDITDAGVWRALRLEFWRFRHPRAYRLLRRGEYFVMKMRESSSVAH